MNVLFYLDRFPGYGGIETVTATLANAFAARGVGVTVLSCRAEDVDCVSLALDPAVRVARMPEGGGPAAGRRFLNGLVEREKVDFVVFQDSYAPIERSLDDVWARVPVVVCEHSMPYSFRALPNAPIRRLARRVRHPLGFDPYRFDNRRKRFLYDRCWRYLLLSPSYFGEFRALAKLFDSRKLRAMPNPLTTPKDRLEPAVDWEAKENLVVFAGSLTSAKGATRALEAWRLLRGRGGATGDWRLVVVGDGEEMPACRELVARRSLGDVSLVGYQADVFRFFRRAKVYLHPSSRDGFPMTLVEAMSCGCVPVVFDSFGAARDIVADGRDGALVPPYDIGAFAEAVRTLLADDGRLRLWSGRAREAVARYSASDVCDRWMSLLEKGGAR